MKVVIFGASGATGQNLVSQALQQEHLVTAFVRDPSKFKTKHVNIRVLKGNVSDYHRVDEAIANQDAVLSALGAANPFKRDLMLIKGIQNIVNAMTYQNVKRFVYQSFMGVREYRNELGFVMRTIMPVFLKNVISDHEAKEDIILKSNLDWTIIRCAILTNGSFTGKYRDGEHLQLASMIPTISRRDVADFMLKQITDRKYLYKKPRIVY
jgi:putative NADH-flavin reductase